MKHALSPGVDGDKNPRLKTANLHLVPVWEWVKVKLHLQIVYKNSVFYRVKCIVSLFQCWVIVNSR